MPIYPLPIPTRASKIAVSAYAEGAAKRLGLGPGEPIEPIVAKLGGAIVYRDPTDDERPESIRVEPTRRFKIFLPSVTSMSRDRFTIAHELGHFFLHFPLVQIQGEGMRATRWVDENDRDQQRCEWEANWFAASFIMPEAEFRVAYGNGLAFAAFQFGVSEKAAEVRARSLGL